MKNEIYQVDAFADQIFEGNPAAVCPLEEWLSDEMMQQIAIENNLSETAFFVAQKNGFGLRWFTPTSEVDLCGHATLATAHVLFHHQGYGEPSISFFTKSGKLTVFKEGSDRYAMNFPAKELQPELVPEPVKEGLPGVEFKECFKADDYLLVAKTEAQVRNLKPDFRLLSEVDSRGIIVTAPGEQVDFVSRFFAPRVGVPEDPVTGSAHTMLTPYWSRRLKKNELQAKQVSARGGHLVCRMEGDNRVVISGQACTYLKGEIEVPNK